MFSLDNWFIVKTFLLFFIKLICFREFLLCISSSVGIKHPYIKKCHLTCLQNPGAHTPNLTSFSVAVDGAKDSPVKGCNCGLTRTSLHTSLRSDDAIFLLKSCAVMKSSHLSCKTEHAGCRIFHRSHNMLVEFL